MSREFKRAERNPYNNGENWSLDNFLKNAKRDMMLKLKETRERHDAKRKRHVPIKPSTGYVAKAVRSFDTDLTDKKNDDPKFVKAVKLSSRSYNDLEHLRDPSSGPPKKSGGTGAGLKVTAPEARVALFHWFVDVREELKICLPRRLSKLKDRQLYAEWLIHPIPKNVWTVRRFSKSTPPPPL